MAIYTIHTEDEAKKRWCPMAASAHQAEQHCLGSACMAWKWVRARVNKPDQASVMTTKTYGVCGLTRTPG